MAKIDSSKSLVKSNEVLDIGSTKGPKASSAASSVEFAMSARMARLSEWSHPSSESTRVKTEQLNRCLKKLVSA